jgi:hypothetical protein
MRIYIDLAKWEEARKRSIFFSITMTRHEDHQAKKKNLHSSGRVCTKELVAESFAHKDARVQGPSVAPSLFWCFSARALSASPSYPAAWQPHSSRGAYNMVRGAALPVLILRATARHMATIEVPVREALNMAIDEEMARDERVFLMGNESRLHAVCWRW